MSSSSTSVRLTSDDTETVLREYEATDPLDEEALPEAARRVIANEINDDDERLKMEWLPDGRVQLRATQYVGLVSLPGGLTIEVRPKVARTNLLEMLQYSQGVHAETIAEETAFVEGREFIRAMATLYEAELRDVIRRGLVQEYRQRSATERHVRGRLDVQRQLQRQGPQPLQFECTYDELTRDTVLNQAILYATTILLQLVGNGRVGSALQRHRQVLQREIELRPVRAVELDHIELSRLANHYEDLFRLTKLILRGAYAEELRSGARSSFSLLVDMNEIFEGVVEHAVQEAVKGTDLTARSQATSSDLVWGGSRDIRIRPDIVVEDDENTLFVGDAKWKLDTSDSPEPSNSDIYQLLSYQVAHDAPGVLFYPAQNNHVASEYVSKLNHPLTLVEIPVAPAPGENYNQTVLKTVKNLITSLQSPA